MIFSSGLLAFLGGGSSALATFVIIVLSVIGVLIVGFAVGTLYIMLRQNIDFKSKKRYRKDVDNI